MWGNSRRSMPVLIGAACVLALAGIVMAGATLSIGAIRPIAVLLVLALLIFLVSAKSSALHVCIAVTLYLFAHSHAGAEAPEAAAYARALALLVILIAAARLPANTERQTSPELLVLIAVGTSAFGFAMATRGIDQNVATDALSFALSCLTLIVAVRRLPIAMLRTGVERTILLALIASLVTAFLKPGEALPGGRLEGLFSNANTLGFFAAIGLLLAMTAQDVKTKWTLFVVSGVVLVATGSRSSLLAIAIAMILTTVVVIIRAEARSSTLLALTALGCVIGYFASRSFLAANLSILRENNSRSIGTHYAWHVAGAAPWRGVGYGRSAVEIASTPLRWLAETGYVGMGLVLATYVLILLVAWRHSWPAFLVAVFGVVSSTFEGWYFAGGSGLFLCYWVVYFSGERSAVRADHLARRDAATDPGLRRVG